jgi:hypothetical protein
LKILHARLSKQKGPEAIRAFFCLGERPISRHANPDRPLAN